MKTNMKFLPILLGLLTAFSTVFAQSLSFQYIAPTDSMKTHFGAGNIFSRMETASDGSFVLVMPGYRWTRLTGARVATFKSIAPDNLVRTYDSLTQNSALKRKVDHIMQLSGGVVDVVVYLIDDRAGLDPVSRITTREDEGTHLFFAWPAANNYISGGSYFGYTYLGEIASRKWGGNDWKNWEGTILHEISHTQFLPDPEYGRNKWGAANGVTISYGGEQGHYIQELMADPQMPLDEGLGTFWATEYNYPASAARLLGFLNNTDARFWLGSRSFLTSIPEMWNAPHEVEWSGPVSSMPSKYAPINTRLTPNQGNYDLRKYKWLDVPGKFVMYNEQMATAMLYLYWQYACAQKDTAYSFIYDAATDMAQPNVHDRYPAYVANHLALSMEAFAATPAGQAEKTSGTLRSSMFAYALLDIMEHFGRSEESLKREFTINKVNNQLPLAFDAYWDHREAIKNRVSPHIARDHIDIEAAISQAKDYFTQANTILP